MARSMTGFGRGSASSGAVEVNLEVRTLNHKHRSVHVQGLRDEPELETHLRALLADRVSRGSIHATVQLDPGAAASTRVQVDLSLARSYQEALQGLGEQLGVGGPPKLDLLANLPGVLRLTEPALDREAARQALGQATHQACESVQDLRQKEGRRLTEVVLERVGSVRRLLEKIPLLHQESLVHYRQRLRERVERCVQGTEVSVDPGRLELEVVLLAEKSDVTEELERLSSHLQQFDRLVRRDEPVGRRLDFLCQEISRECNTISAKSHDATIAGIVVDMKAEVQRIREQVQNLE